MKSKFAAAFICITLLFSVFSPVKAQDSTQYPTYVIQSGDTLLSIANQFGVTLDNLIAANNIADPNIVSVGTQLVIPIQGISGMIAFDSVQLGETLRGLSIEYQIDPSTLLKLNQITSPGQIYPGSQLILPVVDSSKTKVPISQVSSSQTLLEVAAQNNTSTWNLLDQNNDPIQFDLLPGDMIYRETSQNPKEISSIDPKLTSVAISPLPLVQGKTFEITVVSTQSVELSGSLNGSTLHFFPLDNNNQQVALQGIYAMANPGLAPFTLSGKFQDGSTFSYQQSVLLISGDYPTEGPLTVDPSTIDPKVTKPEDDLVDQLTSVVTPTRYWSGMFMLPAVYDQFNDLFGNRRSYNNGAFTSFHSGVDFAGGMGLPITAPADGKVVFAGPLTVRGNATFIDHGWGIFTAYFHQSEIDVKVGDMVKAGQVIGKVGNTGRVEDVNAFPGAGSHLHWEVWVNGIQVDPLEWLAKQYP